MFAWLFVLLERCLPSLALPSTDSPLIANSARLAFHPEWMSKFSLHVPRVLERACTWLPVSWSWISQPGLSTFAPCRRDRRMTMCPTQNWPTAVQPPAIPGDRFAVFLACAELMRSAQLLACRAAQTKRSQMKRSQNGSSMNVRVSLIGSLEYPLLHLGLR